MFGWLKAKKIQKEKALFLYTSCVEQARTPLFYSALDVGDTMEGRFEMICMHVSLVINFLNKSGDHARAQNLFDVMFIDIDRNLREEGVGDLAVPKRIKKMMKALKGRALSYQNGLESGQLDRVVTRNIGVTDPTLIDIFVRYIKECATTIEGSLASDTSEKLFPSPATLETIRDSAHAQKEHAAVSA